MDRRAALALLTALPAMAALGSSPPTLVDPTGRRVTLPPRVARIGCLTGAAYEKACVVGAADKVVVRQATSPPWMVQTHPAVARVPVLVNSHQPNLEDLLRWQPDVLFSWDDPLLTRKLEENGLTVVCPQPARRKLQSPQDFVRLLQAEVAVYGEVLGPEAARRAAAWGEYLARTVARVSSRLADLPPGARPATYYVRGPAALVTHGPEENLSWFGQLAGADMVVRRSGVQGIAQVSLEQILIWDPEVIFVGRQYSTDLVLADPRWRKVRAVRNGRVQVIPDGVFYWDSSSEGVLLLLFMAKALHPERFEDIDLNQEVRAYYRNFYGYPLSEAEAQLLLAGRNPQGQRVNPLGN